MLLILCQQNAIHPAMPKATPANTSRITRDGKSLTLIAFVAIRADILNGRLKPNTRLRINTLAADYEVGATAVREALSRLVTEGLVESQEQRGFSVGPVSREDLLDLTQTRIAIECYALTLSIQNGDVEWESKLVSVFHKLSRYELPITPETNPEWSATHQEFHEALLAGCGSVWTLNVCKLLYDKSERYRNLAARQLTANRDTRKEHRRLMDAALARDAVKASKLLAAHFNQTANNVLDVM